MNFLKKIDIKTWFIIILGIALIISFFFGQRNKIDYKKDEITNLREENKKLLKKYDSLNIINNKIDILIVELNKKIDSNTQILSSTNKEIQDLKKKQNEIPRYVNNLSANGVSNAFTDFLDKSTNNH